MRPARCSPTSTPRAIPASATTAAASGSTSPSSSRSTGPKELFGAEHANVQPHAGRPGEQRRLHGDARARRHDHGDGPRPRRPPHARDEAERLGQALRRRRLPRAPRGHSSSTWSEVARLAQEHKPKVIVAGWSAYPRQLDFAAFREIADSVGAKLMVDMAHFAGLVAAGEHPSPRPARRRGHHDDPQDPRRPAQRDDPLQGGAAPPTSTAPSSRASRAAR